MSGNIRDFFHAVIRGDTEVVKSLLPSININSKDEKGDGDTALIKALYMENEDMVSFLLENGADPNIKNDAGENAFNYPNFKGPHELYKAIQRLTFSKINRIPDDLTEKTGTLVNGGSKSKKKKLRKSSKVRKSRKVKKSRKLRKSRKVRKSRKLRKSIK